MFNWCPSPALRAELLAYASDMQRDQQLDGKFTDTPTLEWQVVREMWDELHSMPRPNFDGASRWRLLLRSHLVNCGVLVPLSAWQRFAELARGRTGGTLRRDWLHISREGTLYAFAGWPASV